MSISLLVVDDESSTLQVLKAVLEPLSCNVTALTDSEQAAQRIEEQKFDGIIVDVHMPAPDGFELTRRVRASALNKRAPIVLLTGMDDVQTMREGFKAGATCFLGKPVTRERIHNLVNALRGSIMVEQRRHARLPYRTKVECSWGEHRERHMVVESLNIGEGGMSFKPPGGLEAGLEVTLEFELPSAERPLRMRARVLPRQSPDFTAVEFIDSAVRDQETIQNYILGRLQG
jgi:CheY-like chemotaxis protein